VRGAESRQLLTHLSIRCFGPSVLPNHVKAPHLDDFRFAPMLLKIHQESAYAPDHTFLPNMGDRHFLSNHLTLVLRSLTSLVNTQPNLSAIISLKTVINPDHDDSKVTLICGGGAAASEADFSTLSSNLAKP